MGGEESVWISSGGIDLYGMAHVPESDPVGAVVFCNPIFEERKSAHRALVEAARCFSRRGLAVLRFDYRGCGDSGGAFEAFSVPDWLEDIGAALGWVRARFGGSRVALLGLRLGGLLARRAAGEGGVEAIALWEPPASGGGYLEDELRRKLVKEMMTFGSQKTTRAGLLEELRAGGTIDFDGYAVTSALYRGLCGLDLAEEAGGHKGRCLLAHINHQDRPSRQMETVRAALAARGVAVDFRTVVMQPFWSLIGHVDCSTLTELTARWMLTGGKEPAEAAGPGDRP